MKITRAVPRGEKGPVEPVGAGEGRQAEEQQYAIAQQPAVESERLLLELQARQIELETQNERLRQMLSGLEKLKEIEALSSILETTPYLIYIYDLQEDRNIYTNRSLTQILGYLPEEVRDYDRNLFAIMLHPDDLPRVDEHHSRIAAAGDDEVIELEYRMKHASGEWITLRSRDKVFARDDQGRVKQLLGSAEDVTARKRTEESLRDREAQFTAFMSYLPAAAFVKDATGRTLFANQYLQQLLDFGDWENKTTPELIAGEAGQRMAEDDRQTLEHGPRQIEETINDCLGETRTFKTIKFPICVEGKPVFLGGISLEITDSKRAEQERDRLEKQLLQAQKMEAVGRLAGGVAHDFNNMLGVILGHAELALMNIGPDEPLFEGLQEILKAAERSADLTRQLLTFARKQTASPRVLDINETVEGMLKMLRRLIGEDVELVWLPGEGLFPLKIDPSQIDQILANLCVNARQAIDGNGRIIIETENVSIDSGYCAAHPGLAPGDYVALFVSDTGCGMERETLPSIFEPFFTTKALGEGTGLGLATVYGIVKQNNGYIEVASEPGQGTTFSIFFPPHTGREEQLLAKGGGETISRGHETVLLVEDEPTLLTMSKTMLESLGYRVMATSRAEQAIELAAEHGSGIQLLLTDVIMPGMDGRELSRKLLAINPELRCLFMSGYTANIITDQGDKDINFMMKPFSLQGLAEKVRKALE